VKRKLSGAVVFGFFAGAVVYAAALCVFLAAASALSRALQLDLYFTRDGAVAAVIAAVCVNQLTLAVFGFFARRAPGAKAAFCKFLIALACAAAAIALAYGAYYLLFYPAMSILLCALSMHREIVSLREAESDEAETDDQ
jgi:hypothetical protein